MELALNYDLGLNLELEKRPDYNTGT